MIAAGRKEMVRLELGLSNEESAAFWPIYDAYEVARKELGKRRIELLEKFVSKYPAISAEELDEIVDESFDIHEELIDLEQDTYDELKDKASVMTAAKFVQIEGFLNTVIQAELQVRLPFIGEFHMEAKKDK